MSDLSLPVPASSLSVRASSPHLSLRLRVRRRLTIEFDLTGIAADEATLHTDLADLFERGIE